LPLLLLNGIAAAELTRCHRAAPKWHRRCRADKQHTQCNRPYTIYLVVYGGVQVTASTTISHCQSKIYLVVYGGVLATASARAFGISKQQINSCHYVIAQSFQDVYRSAPVSQSHKNQHRNVVFKARGGSRAFGSMPVPIP